MAVFPDRIVLKNSTDDQATIEAAIGAGGADEIVYGELVIGRENGSAQLYTVDANGDIVTISGGGGGASGLGDLTDVDLSTTPPVDGNALVYDGTKWVPGDGGGGSATLGRGDGGDLDLQVVDSAFVFGVYGGGDLDATAEDRPVELVSYDIDGGELT